MDKSLTLSVVLPAYKEEGNIENTVSQALSYLDESCEVYEVIEVNDGSSDRTGEIVQALASSNPRIILVNHPETRGYSSAVLSGIDRASSDYIFLMDSGGHFDITELDRFLHLLEDSVALIGYREKRADPFLSEPLMHGSTTFISGFFSV